MKEGRSEGVEKKEQKERKERKERGEQSDPHHLYLKATRTHHFATKLTDPCSPCHQHTHSATQYYNNRHISGLAHGGNKKRGREANIRGQDYIGVGWGKWKRVGRSGRSGQKWAEVGAKYEPYPRGKLPFQISLPFMRAIMTQALQVLLASLCVPTHTPRRDE